MGVPAPKSFCLTTVFCLAFGIVRAVDAIRPMVWNRPQFKVRSVTVRAFGCIVLPESARSVDSSFLIFSDEIERKLR